MTRPPVALTCGEPAGVGLELSEKAWQVLRGSVPFFVIADPSHLPGRCPHQVIATPGEALAVGSAALPVLAHPFRGASRPGTLNPDLAADVVAVIARGVALVQQGAACALCTNPIHKKTLHEGAGFGWPGHTEYLAHLSKVSQVAMMLVGDTLRVVPATTHIPLAQVRSALTREHLTHVFRLTAQALVDQFGIPAPRLAVAGLNPHAGEGGLMGSAEATLIAPVIRQLQHEGLSIRGPLAADSMFHLEARKQFDVALCMYHDQALIPLKTLYFDTAVNLTLGLPFLGLPFLCTSPDHGTALDIAGRGRANASSLIAALRLAWQMRPAQRPATMSHREPS
ncbi:MAG: 4-hydroxythreonine-4-phosphate dehydrogenase PdxA [Rhodobacteraceae bacterium]|nr:4-hydroxythreonine-4-phosphate dehydrogenase PdxA [Paracoccaceae bacterium]